MVGHAARTCGEFPPLSEPSSRTRGSPLKAEHETTLTLHSNFNFQAAKCETAGLAEGESTQGALDGGDGGFQPGNLRREGLSAPLEQGSDLGPRTHILWGTLGTTGGHSAYWMLGAPLCPGRDTPNVSWGQNPPALQHWEFCSLSKRQGRLAQMAWIRPATKGGGFPLPQQDAPHLLLPRSLYSPTERVPAPSTWAGTHGC